MTRNYIPKHKTPFLPIRWRCKFDRHNFYWACHFSRRFHRLKNKERYAKRIRETWQGRFIRDLEQIQTLIYDKYTRPMRLSKEESERLLDWLDEEKV